MQKSQIYETHACQNTVAMETSKCLGQDMSNQIVARSILRKVAKFGDVCLYIERVINAQSHFYACPPHPRRPKRVN